MNKTNPLKMFTNESWERTHSNNYAAKRESISTRKGYVAVLKYILLLFRLTDQEMTAIAKFVKITDP